jgi:hypothetical protein
MSPPCSGVTHLAVKVSLLRARFCALPSTASAVPRSGENCAIRSSSACARCASVCSFSACCCCVRCCCCCCCCCSNSCHRADTVQGMLVAPDLVQAAVRDVLPVRVHHRREPVVMEPVCRVLAATPEPLYPLSRQATASRPARAMTARPATSAPPPSHRLAAMRPSQSGRPP